MCQVLWTKFFLQVQGYDVKRSKVLQDNMSAILFEKNARMSGIQRTKNINIRFNFITNHITAVDADVKHFLAHQMFTNFFTKTTARYGVL